MESRSASSSTKNLVCWWVTLIRSWCLECIASNGIVNHRLERICKEAVVA
jgi:hypothetical protein